MTNEFTNQKTIVLIDYCYLPIRCKYCLSTEHCLKDCPNRPGPRPHKPYSAPPEPTAPNNPRPAPTSIDTNQRGEELWTEARHRRGRPQAHLAEPPQEPLSPHCSARTLPAPHSPPRSPVAAQTPPHDRRPHSPSCPPALVPVDAVIEPSPTLIPVNGVAETTGAARSIQPPTRAPELPVLASSPQLDSGVDRAPTPIGDAAPAYPQHPASLPNLNHSITSNGSEEPQGKFEHQVESKISSLSSELSSSTDGYPAHDISSTAEEIITSTFDSREDLELQSPREPKVDAIMASTSPSTGDDYVIYNTFPTSLSPTTLGLEIAPPTASTGSDSLASQRTRPPRSCKLTGPGRSLTLATGSHTARSRRLLDPKAKLAPTRKGGGSTIQLENPFSLLHPDNL